ALGVALMLTAVVSFQARAQTPPTSPPNNPPTPTPIPTVVPVTPVTAAAQTGVSTRVLDSFDSVSQWTTTPAEGVEISVHRDSSAGHPTAMRVDFDFHRHGGYAVIHRP